MSADDHGRQSTYVNYKCRCVRCRAAWADYMRRFRIRRAAQLAADPTTATHGSATTYADYGCRCRPCTVAHTAKRMAQRRAQREEAGS